MSSENAISEQLDEINKLITNLENIDVQIGDEDQALLLLYSWPKVQDHFKETLLYGSKILSLEEA